MSSPREPSFDVIGLGTICWDLVGTVPRYPALDEKTALTALIQQGGGNTATGLVAVARLGGRAAAWGRIGDDEYGRKCRDEFLQEGVDTTHLELVPGKTSQVAFCVAQEGTGHRTIFWKAGDAGSMAPEELDREALLDCRCLLLSANHSAAAVQAAAWAREAGIPVVLDLERPRPGADELMRLCDHPIVPWDYATEACGISDPLEAGECLQRQLGGLLIITRGDQGAVAFLDGGRTHFQPAFPVEPVVDTTGAGDVYHGAFAYGLALGYGLEENMRFSAAVAALKCRALGGRTGIPTMQEVRLLLSEGPSQHTAP